MSLLNEETTTTTTTTTNTDEALVLSQQNLDRKTDRSKLTDEQLSKYDNWKNQPGMAQIKLEFIDFDHEIRYSVEHLNETDKKKLTNETENSEEPKKKKFKVIIQSFVSYYTSIYSIEFRVKIKNISK